MPGGKDARASEKKSLVGAISGRARLAVKGILPNMAPPWIVKLAPQVEKAEKLADDSIEAATKVVADRKAMEEAIMLERRTSRRRSLPARPTRPSARTPARRATTSTAS